jgi:hypothetical protein
MGSITKWLSEASTPENSVGQKPVECVHRPNPCALARCAGGSAPWSLPNGQRSFSQISRLFALGSLVHNTAPGVEPDSHVRMIATKHALPSRNGLASSNVPWAFSNSARWLSPMANSFHSLPNATRLASSDF